MATNSCHRLGIVESYGSAGNLDYKVALLGYGRAVGPRFWDFTGIYADNEDIVGAYWGWSGKRDENFLVTQFRAHAVHATAAPTKGAIIAYRVLTQSKNCCGSHVQVQR